MVHVSWCTNTLVLAWLVYTSCYLPQRTYMPTRLHSEFPYAKILVMVTVSMYSTSGAVYGLPPSFTSVQRAIFAYLDSKYFCVLCYY